MQNKNKLTYRQVGDYLIPNLTLPPEEANIQLGKWGILHKDYLRKHKPVVLTTLFAQGKLWRYLADVDFQAQQMFDTLVEQMKESEDVAEQLKEDNQMLWVQMMNSIQNRSNEVVYKDMIFK